MIKFVRQVLICAVASLAMVQAALAYDAASDFSSSGGISIPAGVFDTNSCFISGRSLSAPSTPVFRAQIYLGTPSTGNFVGGSSIDSADGISVPANTLTASDLETECGLTDVVILTEVGPAANFGLSANMSLVFEGKKDGALHRGEVSLNGAANGATTLVNTWARVGTAPVPAVEPAADWRFQPNTGRWEFDIKSSEDFRVPFVGVNAEEFYLTDLVITGATIHAFDPIGGCCQTDGVRVSIKNITGDVTVSVPANSYKGVTSGEWNSASNSVTFSAPTAAPTVTLGNFTEVFDGLGNVDHLTTELTVDQPFVMILASGANFNLTNGTVSSWGGLDTSALPSVNPAGSYTVKVQPTASGLISFDTGTAVRNGQNIVGTSNTITYTFADTSVPVASLEAIKDNGIFLYTKVNFSEAVTGFALDDLDLVNATAEITFKSYVLVVLKLIPIADGEISVTVKAAAVLDGGANANVASNTVTYLHDTTAPTVVLSALMPHPSDASLLVTTATFSEDVVFSTSAIEARAVNVSDLSVSGSGSVFTFTLTPAGSGLVSLQLIAGDYTDASPAKNPNTEISNKVEFTFADTIPPVLKFSAFSLDGDGITLRTSARIFNGPTGDLETAVGLTEADLVLSNATVKFMAVGDSTFYHLQITPTGGLATLSVAANSFTDAAGNQNAVASNEITFNFVDTTPPEITLGPLTDTGSGQYTSAISLTEDASDFTVSDLGLTNATATLTGSGKSYVATLTPLANGTVTLIVAAGAFSDDSGNLSLISNSVTDDFTDTFPPEITLGALVPTGNGVFTSAITITETVSDFAVGDLTVVGAGSAQLTGSGQSYTATITATVDGLVKLSVAAGTFTDAGGLGNTASNEVTVVYDGSPPVVTIGAFSGPVGGKYTSAITLSEPVTSFTLANLTLSNATATMTGAGTSFSAVLTPLADGLVKLSVGASEVADPSGNQNMASNVESATFDSVRPTVTIAALVRVGGIYTAQITLSEAVASFDKTNLSLTNATAMLSGSGTSFTATLTPLADGAVKLSVAEAELQDAAGNDNFVSNEVSANFVAILPQAALSAPVGPSSGVYSMAVSLNVSSTNFVAGDITVTNGSVTGLSGAGQNYIATVTPAGDGAMTAVVKANTFTDASSNNNAVGNTVKWSHDGTPPTVVIGALTGPTGGVYTATITISEDTTDFIVGDLNLTNATATLTGAGKVYTVKLTPVADGQIKVSVDADKLTDAAGNGNTASNASTATFDATPPTVSIAALTGPAAGKFTATITLSEPATNFALVDLTLVNATATLTPVSSTVYTAELTPVAQGSVSVSVGASTFTDAAGNGNIASNTATAIFDTVAPTVVISGLPSEITEPGTHTATITFSEDVTGFALADVTVTGGSVTILTGGPAIYVATIQATASGDLVVSVAAAVAQDAANNDNIASNPVTVENKVAEITEKQVAEAIQSRASAILNTTPVTVNFLNPAANSLTSRNFNLNASNDGLLFNFSGSLLSHSSSKNYQGKRDIWLQLMGVRTHLNSTKGDILVGYLGGHIFLSEQRLVGMMLQFDYASTFDSATSAQGAGFGYMIGPYFAGTFGKNNGLRYEVQARVGQSYNTISPLGTFNDNYKSFRKMLHGNLEGSFSKGEVLITPNAQITYFTDKSESYVDGLNNTIASQTAAVGEFRTGVKLSRDFQTKRGIPINARVGLSVASNFIANNSTGAQAFPFGTGDLRGRVNFGATTITKKGWVLSFDTFYEGLGTPNYESFGFTARAEIRF